MPLNPGIDIKSHIRRQYLGLARALKYSRDHLKHSRSCMPYSNTPHALVFLGLSDRWFQEISISAIDASFIPNFYQFVSSLTIKTLDALSPPNRLMLMYPE